MMRPTPAKHRSIHCRYRILALLLFLIGWAPLSVTFSIEDAQAASKTARCITLEMGKTAAQIPIHMPLPPDVDRRVRKLQDNAQNIDKLTGTMTGIYDGYRAGQDMAQNRATSVAPFLGQNCYTAHISRIDEFVSSFDTATPKTSHLYPKLEEWKPPIPCKAYETLGNSLETIDLWVFEIEDKIDQLTDQKNKLENLNEAAGKLGTEFLRLAEGVTQRGNWSGLLSWYAATELTSYGTYFTGNSAISGGLAYQINQVINKIDTKLKGAEAAKENLKKDRHQMLSVVNHIKDLNNVKACGLLGEVGEWLMKGIIASKKESDSQRLIAVTRPEASGAEALDFLNSFLEVLTGMAGAGTGGGAPGRNPRCAQVLAQINADRNQLRASGGQYANVIRQSINANVSWYNSNCR